MGQFCQYAHYAYLIGKIVDYWSGKLCIFYAMVTLLSGLNSQIVNNIGGG